MSQIRNQNGGSNCHRGSTTRPRDIATPMQLPSQIPEVSCRSSVAVSAAASDGRSIRETRNNCRLPKLTAHSFARHAQSVGASTRSRDVDLASLKQQLHGRHARSDEQAVVAPLAMLVPEELTCAFGRPK